MKTDTYTHIRWIIRRDMQRVLQIEGDSFEFPWTEEDFIRSLRQRNVIGMVCEDEDEHVSGFMVYELQQHSLNLWNIAVDPLKRREGFGVAMIDKLRSKLHPDRRNRILAAVRETNLSGQLFFRDCGFKAISVLRQHFEETGEDAYLMQYRC